MEHIIPDKFIRMCRLLEITTFPVHWKFEEKDQQIVVTFIWNIGSSEVFTPTPTQATPKVESTVAIDSKKDSEIQKEHSASASKQSALHHPVLKSETSTKDASSTDKRRSKSKSSSRTTSPAASTEGRQSTTAKHKEKRADDKNRLEDVRCEMTQNIFSSKHKNLSNNANVCLEKINGSKGSDGPKPHQESSTKHRHSSSNSEKKHTTSSSKDANSEKGKSSVRSCSVQKHRHSSSNSEKKHTISSSKDANSEKGKSSVRSCSVQKHRHSSSNSEKKHTISSSKDANSETEQSSVRSCSDQKQRHSSSNSEKKHSISSSKDANSETEQNSVRSCSVQKQRHSSSNSEKKHRISSSKDANSETEQSSVRSCSVRKQRHSSSISSSKVQLKDTAEQEIGSNLEVNIQTDTVTDTCGDNKVSKQQNKSVSRTGSEVKKEESAPKESSLRKEHKSKDSTDTNHKTTRVPDEKKYRELTSLDAKRHVKPSSRDQEKHTESSLRHAKETHNTQSRRERPKDKDPRREQSKKDPSSRREETQDGVTATALLRNESQSDEPRCERIHKEPSLRNVQSAEESRCEQLSKVSTARCEQSVKRQSALCEQKRREEAHNASLIRSEQIPLALGSHCDTVPKITATGSEQMGKQKSNRSSSSCEKTTKELSSRCESKDSQCNETREKSPNILNPRDFTSRREKTSKETISENNKNPKTSKTKNTMEGVVVSRDRLKQTKKCSVKTNDTKSKDASANSLEQHRSLEGGRSTPDKAADSASSGLSRGKRRKDCIKDEQPKKLKMDADIKPMGQSKDVKPLGPSKDVKPLGQSKDVNPLGQSKDVHVNPSGQSKDVKPSGQSKDVKPLGQSKDVKPLGQSKEAKPLGQSTEVINSEKPFNSLEPTHNEESPEESIILTLSTPATKDSSGPTNEVSAKEPIIQPLPDISKKQNQKDSSGPTNEVSPEEASKPTPPAISQKPDTKDLVSDTPRGTTTLFQKNDLWEMFVNRCKVKTDVQFSDQPIKETIAKHGSVDPDAKIGSPKVMQSNAKYDQNSKIKQSTEKNKKHGEIPPKDRKEEKSKPTRKSSTQSRLNKSGSSTHLVKNSTKTKTAESKMSPKHSTENISVPKKPSMESIEKNQPSRLSNNGKMTFPVPEETSTDQNTKSRECIMNMERVLESKDLREDVDITAVDADAAVIDPSEDTDELPKEPHGDDPVDSDEDDGFSELQIDLEHDDSKSDENEEEKSLIDPEDSQPQVLESHQERNINPSTPCELTDDRIYFDEMPQVEDPLPTGRRDDVKGNSSQEQIEQIEELTNESASSNQKISLENGLPKNTPLEEGIVNNNSEKQDINSDKLEKNKTSNDQQVREEIASDKLDNTKIGSNKQETVKISNSKLEKEEIHSNITDEKRINNEPEDTEICYMYKELQKRGSLNAERCENINNNQVEILDNQSLERGVYNPEGCEIINKDQEKEENHESDLEEGEIEDEDEDRDTYTEINQNKDKNVAHDVTVFDNIFLACSPVSSIEPQIDEEPSEGLERNEPCAGLSRSQTPSPTQCHVHNRTGSSTTSSPSEGVQTPSSIYIYQTEDLDGVSRASTPLLDEMNILEVPEVPGFRTVILPESECLQKQCSQVKSQVRIPDPDSKKRRNKKNKSTNQSLEPELMDIFQGEKLSRRKRRRLLKQLRKQISELPDSPHENMKVEIQKEQKRQRRANQAAKLWIEPRAGGTQEPPTHKKRHVTDWDNLLQQHIHEMKRPKSKDAKTEDLNKKIDNFLIEIDLKNNKNCPNTFLQPNQMYKETTKLHRPVKTPKQVNFGNLIDVQSYTGTNAETSFDEREQFDHDSLMDSIIISSTRQEEHQEKTPNKRKRNTDDSDSDSDQDQDVDPQTRKFQRTTSRSLPRMNRDIAIQQRNSPDTGLHQYLFLYEDSRPCSWIDSDEIKEHNPHFYSSLKKCFVPKEGSQEQSELQQKLYNLVGFPS